MKLRGLFTALVVLGLGAGIAFGQSKMPAKQVSASTNGWDEIFRSGSIMPTIDHHTNTAQYVFEWIDDNFAWLRFTVSTNTSDIAYLQAALATNTATDNARHVINTNEHAGLYPRTNPSNYVSEAYVTNAIDNRHLLCGFSAFRSSATEGNTNLTQTMSQIRGWTTGVVFHATGNVGGNGTVTGTGWTLDIGAGRATCTAGGSGYYNISATAMAASTNSIVPGAWVEVIKVGADGHWFTNRVMTDFVGSIAGAQVITNVIRTLYSDVSFISPVSEGDYFFIRGKRWLADGQTWIELVSLEGLRAYR